MADAVPSRATIPESLLEYDQWLCWRTEKRDGKATKIPVNPKTGEFASTTDPETWASFDVAHEQVQRGDENGIGFVFTDDDPFVGVDLDDCRVPETATTLEWATDIIDELDSFTEISPSGTGFHVLVEGSLPDGRNRKDDVELYETARFFTVTGDHVDGTPTEIHTRPSELRVVYNEYVAPTEQTDTDSQSGTETDRSARSLEDDDLLQKAKTAANGEKFQQLWRGSTSGYESHSEADMALCSLLAFWTGGDERQVDRLFRDSGLMREKWDEVHFADGSTYGEKTIERAVAGTSEFYEPPLEASNTSEQASEPTIDLQEVRSREVERTERLEELQQRLNDALEEKERLESELESERERRKALESQLEEEQNDDRSFFDFL
jgi:putative DNA primase/helicase